MIPFISIEESLPLAQDNLSPSPLSFQSSDDTASFGSDLDKWPFDDTESDTHLDTAVPFQTSSDSDTATPLQASSNPDADAQLQTTRDCDAATLQSSSDPGDASELQRSEETSDILSINAGYKIVFDNIDKNVRPRFMRSEHQTRSLHFVHSFAVKDRIAFSQFSSKTPTEVNVFDILPDDNDYKSLKSDFAVLVSRMIVEYMPFFSADYKGISSKYIPHKYSKQMSSKSEVVSV